MSKNKEQENITDGQDGSKTLKRKDSFIGKVAKFINENPKITNAVIGAAAAVAGSFTGGLGAVAVGAGGALLKYTAETAAQNWIERIEAEEQRLEMESEAEDLKEKSQQRGRGINKQALVQDLQALIVKYQESIASKNIDEGFGEELEGNLEELKKIEEKAVHDMVEEDRLKVNFDFKRNLGQDLNQKAGIDEGFDEKDVKRNASQQENIKWGDVVTLTLHNIPNGRGGFRDIELEIELPKSPSPQPRHVERLFDGGRLPPSSVGKGWQNHGDDQNEVMVR